MIYGINKFKFTLSRYFCGEKAKYILLIVVLLGLNGYISACSPPPLLPFDQDSPPMALFPISKAGIKDERGRFRDIFCSILETRREVLPDYQSCDEALTKVGREPQGSDQPVSLGHSHQQLKAVLVPGVGWGCFSNWLDPQNSIAEHLESFGFGFITLEVDALSSSTHNAQQIRNAILSMESGQTEADLVLIGYSKGSPDILEAIATYPEIHHRIAAVVSLAGAVGGSPLANDAKKSYLEIMQHWPEADCTLGDAGAIESLLPSVRKDWLANTILPEKLPYFSLVTYPQPDRISRALDLTYQKLETIDARNDGQLLFYDQFIPNSSLLGFLNADHWAVAVPIERSHPTLGKFLVNHNTYPREALFEAILRFIEERL